MSKDRTAHIDLVPSAPTIDEADVHEAVQTFANPAMSGPVALDLEDQTVRLQPRDFAATLSMRADGGVLRSREVAAAERAGPAVDNEDDGVVGRRGGRGLGERRRGEDGGEEESKRTHGRRGRGGPKR